MLAQSETIQTRKRVKVVLLGDRSVGKSSIINRFITNQFQQHLQPTIGVDFMGKNIKYKGNIYRIQLWDTAGQQKYRSLVKGYLKGAHACVFVYDCTSMNSYKNLIQWLSLFDSVANPQTYKLIVGNKCDTDYHNQNIQQQKILIKSNNQLLINIPEFISSAKLGINIQIIFQSIMENFQVKHNLIQRNNHINSIFHNITRYSKNNCCQSSHFITNPDTYK